MIRALMCAGIAMGESRLVNPLVSDDTLAAQNVLQELGALVTRDDGHWLVSGGKLRRSTHELFCNESAATLRFITAVCAMIPGEHKLTAAPSLSKRPISPLLEVLSQMGIRYKSTKKSTPLIIHGGKILGGGISLPGDISSQYISALLLAAPLADREMKVILSSNPRSKPYIMMTIKCMESFGVNVDFALDFSEYRVKSQRYKATRYVIENDWSSAAYFLALGAAAGEVTVTGLNLNSVQADKAIISILKDMGANVVAGNDNVTVRRSELRPVTADLSDCIDLLPTVSVLAALADGTSEFTGISNARLKESNRVKAVKSELRKMHVKVKEKKDSLFITGGYPRSAEIDSWGDHRMAMAFSILGTVCGATIEGAECVSKTFPGYWEVLKNAGVEMKKDE